MIKGKFYTGLPSEMMTRSRVVKNRQNTNFFWPDESDMVSVADKSKRTPSKTSSSASATVTNFNNDATNSTDIKPKELFRKQLSSGIEFYDDVNAKTPESRRRRFKKIDNVNLNTKNNNNDDRVQPERKKLETFSSKIEFYDFENGTDVKNGKYGRIEQPVKPMKKEIDQNINEVKQHKIDMSEMNKKRISFRDSEEKTKGILKKSDDRSSTDKVVVKPMPKRGLLPKNMSKSVENISKMAKYADEDDLKMVKEPQTLSSIIREVKQMNLSQERKPHYDRYDRNENDNYFRRRPTKDYYDDEPKWNNKDYRPHGGYRDEPDHYSERNYRNDGPKSPKYDDRYDDRRGRDREYNDYNRYDRRQTQPREIYRSGRYDESPIRERYTPENRNYERGYEKRGPVQRKSSDSYYDKPTRSVRYNEEYSTTSSSSYRSPEHLPQHLRTNIVLGKNNVGPQTQRPISVRNSAVNRVGVGLPDYE